MIQFCITKGAFWHKLLLDFFLLWRSCGILRLIIEWRCTSLSRGIWFWGTHNWLCGLFCIDIHKKCSLTTVCHDPSPKKISLELQGLAAVYHSYHLRMTLCVFSFSRKKSAYPLKLNAIFVIIVFTEKKGKKGKFQ